MIAFLVIFAMALVIVALVPHATVKPRVIHVPVSQRSPRVEGFDNWQDYFPEARIQREQVISQFLAQLDRI